MHTHMHTHTHTQNTHIHTHTHNAHTHAHICTQNTHTHANKQTNTSYPQFPVPSGPPEDLTTVEKSSTWFVVSWKDPHPARRGDVNAALSYDLRMNGNSVVEGFKGYSYNFTGLKPLRKHTVSVLTRNSIGVCKDQHAGVISVTTTPVSDQIKHSEL